MSLMDAFGEGTHNAQHQTMLLRQETKHPIPIRLVGTLNSWLHVKCAHNKGEQRNPTIEQIPYL